MIRKPNVTLQSIKRLHELKAVNRIVVRRDAETLLKKQPKTANKVGG